MIRKIGGIEVEVTHPQKVLFPRDGYTKSELIDYYLEVAERMLPYMAGRPVTMVRYPDGIDHQWFFQKNVPPSYPKWLRRIEVVKKGGGKLQHMVCERPADLAFLANMECITPHVWLSTEADLDRPDRMILDLDPASDDFSKVREAALALRTIMEEVGLHPYAMTTGSRGMHVVAPLDRTADFDAARELAKRLAGIMAEREPDRYTVEFSKEERQGRLLIDAFRNSYAQTGVAPYAVRARDGAPVATPISWAEVEDRSLTARRYRMDNISEVLQRDDPWKGIDGRAASVTKAEQRLSKVSSHA